MDSPLMPTLMRRPGQSSPPRSPQSLMADLSLNSESMSPEYTYRQASSSASASASASWHSRNTSSQNQMNEAGDREEDEQQEDEGEEEETPQKPKKAKPRFSLFAAPPRTQPQTQSQSRSHSQSAQRAEADDHDISNEEDGERQDSGDEDQTIHGSSTRPQQTSAERDDKLRESLYELRQMNEVFEGFLGALEAARGHNERLAARVNQTSALLDEYTALMGQTEHNQRLILNRAWTGCEDDSLALQQEAAQRAAQEAAAILESQRAAESARAAQGEKERMTREVARQKEVVRGGGRGRGGGARGRGTAIPPPSNRTPTNRPPSVPKQPTTGIPKPSAGLGGRYADVKSSGYGPSGRK